MLRSVFLSLFFLIPLMFYAQDSDSLYSEAEKKTLLDLSPLQISGQWFLAYKYNNIPGNRTSLFTLKRGYLTFRQPLNEHFSVRFTQDITLDEEGEDAGNIELRLKYCYLNIDLKKILFLHQSNLEIGLVHRPWIDFEQKVNRYRVQGRMYAEKVNLFNSADFGITYSGLIGGVISENYQNNVNSNYPGKYGSFMIGIYNGPGYHAIEQNRSKTIESRITIRPLPEYVPGLQISYSNIYGEANNIYHSDFTFNNIFISSESRYHALTGQYYFGKGDSQGFYSDSTGKSHKNNGYSVFGEVKTLKKYLCVFGRYDYFLSNNENNYINETIIFGLSSYFYRQSKVVADIEINKDSFLNRWQQFYEVAVEIIF